MAEKPEQTAPAGQVVLVYDGECPFCTRYARYMRLSAAAGRPALIDARAGDNPVVQEVKAKGFDLDQGMVAIIDGNFYHGEDALYVLARMSSKSGLFNRMNYFLFRSKTFAALCYPFLRFGRNAALKLKGSKQIHSA